MLQARLRIRFYMIVCRLFYTCIVKGYNTGLQQWCHWRGYEGASLPPNKLNISILWLGCCLPPYQNFWLRASFVPVTQLISSSDDNSRSAAHWADHRRNAESWRALRDTILLSLSHPPGMVLPRTEWLSRLRTCVSLLSCLHKYYMAASAACECAAEDQTVDHAVFQCPIHRPPPWSTAWRFWMTRQSTGCSTPVPRSIAAKQWTETTGSNNDDEAACACVL